MNMNMTHLAVHQSVEQVITPPPFSLRVILKKLFVNFSDGLQYKHIK